MRKLVILVAALLVITGGWYFLWRGMMADDLAQVKATLAHHHEAIKKVTPSATLKTDDVYATGFPFRFRVAVVRPTLTQIWGMETYAVSFDKIELQRSGDRYRMIAPPTFEALYAEDGMAPERYVISLNEVPAVLLRGDKGPLTEFAAQLPSKLVLDVSLNGQTRQIGFDFISIPIPLFRPIPADATRPLQLFVGMLREAMVFKP